MANVVDDMHKYVGARRNDITTESSILVSSSKYLNNALIRGSLPNFMLRKNSPELRTEADHTLGVYAGFEQVRDHKRIEELLTAERKINPQLDAWLEERYLSTWTNDDFAKYAPGTVGGIINRQIKEFGFDISLGRTKDSKKPESQYEYMLVRGGQIHDIEHIVFGSSFDSIGELTPYFVRLANYQKHFSPELAQALNDYMIFGALRIFVRSGLHYPETFAAALECTELGIRIGQASDLYITAKYEDLLGMTPVDVRRVLGIREVVDYHTTREGLIFQEDIPRELTPAAVPAKAAD
jgi:ubiquinone biosynthesis protein COQ4